VYTIDEFVSVLSVTVAAKNVRPFLPLCSMNRSRRKKVLLPVSEKYKKIMHLGA
jgi:hypothetical protein